MTRRQVVKNRRKPAAKRVGSPRARKPGSRGGVDSAPEFHPYANVFPLIEGAEFERLVAGIKRDGFRRDKPVVIYKGQILDGRNRYRAAAAAGVPARMRAYRASDGDPVAFVIAENIDRRHLSPSQAAMAAATFEGFRHGGQRRGAKTGDGDPALARKAAADLFNVSERSVARAAVVRDQGSDELRAAVTQRGLSVSTASELAGGLDKGEQALLLRMAEADSALAGVGKIDERAILKAASEIRKRKGAKRRAERMALVITTAVAVGEHNGARRYPLIYADPPWRHDNPRMGDNGRNIEYHYETMALEDICALRVGELAAPDAVLALWTTVPQSYCAVPPVLAAWGFTYRSEFVWDKVRIGTGFWTRNQHEKLLICTRGTVPAPHGEGCPSSVYREQRGQHSAKPAHFYNVLEAMFPEFMTGEPQWPLMLELFARARRPGWARWGREAPAGFGLLDIDALAPRVAVAPSQVAA